VRSHRREAKRDRGGVIQYMMLQCKRFAHLVSLVQRAVTVTTGDRPVQCRQWTMIDAHGARATSMLHRRAQPAAGLSLTPE
jgi:hypothetical protein